MSNKPQSLPSNSTIVETDRCSMAPLVYTEEGEKVSDQLWKETMEELRFAHPEDILREVSA